MNSAATKNIFLKNEIRLTEVYIRICWKSVGISLGFVAGAFLARMYLFYLGVDHRHRGHSTTTWTEFCHFLTLPPPCVDSFHTLSVDKNRHFWPPPPLILSTYLVIECPLIMLMIGSKVCNSGINLVFLQFILGLNTRTWEIH